MVISSDIGIQGVDSKLSLRALSFLNYACDCTHKSDLFQVCGALQFWGMRDLQQLQNITTVTLLLPGRIEYAFFPPLIDKDSYRAARTHLKCSISQIDSYQRRFYDNSAKQHWDNL